MNTEKLPFRRFGTMIDCSRNAVMTVSSVKKWMDISADLGYTAVLLYIEDTYEVPGEPYFGYGRGRYSQEELREMDAYAKEKGLELIPCIQTLAHLNAIVRWPEYRPIVDVGDILLAGEERTYELIERMFASLSSCMSAKVINVGMDEAHMFGRGKYYDLHGDQNKHQALIEHIKRICAIAAKYGFTLCMWSDMFFKLAVGDYYTDTAKINQEICRQIPDNMQLIYWDYYSSDKKRYDGMLKAHAKIKEGTWFAGGLWSWLGFAPDNEFSMRATQVSLSACRDNQVQDVFLTLWGDNGGECSRFSLLPSMFYAAEIARGNKNKAEIKKKFEEKFGIAFDRFMLLDLKKGFRKGKDDIIDPEKYLLYNDPFIGLLDSTLEGDEAEKFAVYARKLGRLKKHPEWGYLFETSQALCEVLAIKADLSVRTRKAYSSKDPEAIGAIIKEYRRLSKKLEVFYQAYRRQWFRENKGHGFDVQDIRLGGLAQRIRHCAERLQDYAEGRIDRIEELEDLQLNFLGGGETFHPGATAYNAYGENATANVL